MKVLTALGRLCLGTLVFVVILIFAALHPSAAGLMLTFPALNGLGLLFTAQSNIPETARSMLWMPVLNGLLCAVYIVLFLAFSKAEMANYLAIALFFLITVLWVVAARRERVKKGVAEGHQFGYALGVTFGGALFLVIWHLAAGGAEPASAVSVIPGFMRFAENVILGNWWKVLIFLLAFAIFLWIANRPGTPNGVRGIFAGLPLVPFFGLLSIAVGRSELFDNRIETFKGLATGLWLGPAVAVWFVFSVSQLLTWRRQFGSSRVDFLARFGVIVAGWVACFATIIALSAAIDWTAK
jgi:hypothetical protein